MSTFRLSLSLSLSLLLSSCQPALSKKHLLLIGDSNGAREGWAYQLQELRGGGPMVNTSISGNTIGFDYGGDTRLNTLENLSQYLRKGYADMGSIDEIIIMLGTNDCKKRFADDHDRLGANMVELLTRANAFFVERGQPAPRFVLATPPPFGDNDTVVDDFRDGQECIANFSAQLRRIAAERGYCLVDLQTTPGPSVLANSEDGIHFNKAGYVALARAIIRGCY